MIVTMNDNKYNALFAKAYQALKKANQLREGFNDEAHEKLGRFLNVGEYYAHLNNLYLLDPTYTILPIDEGMFEINANSRVITAPKVVVMQNDQLSKVVIFTIDRYVDFMDLNEAQVWVQWTAPGPDGIVREGAQPISIKDTNSIPGKIRLAWLLDNDVTAEAGTVKYSVRFWNKDNFGDEEKVVYSLNTITSTLTVTPSLQPKLNDITTIGDPVGDSVFIRAIRNSKVIGEGIAVPQTPHFSEPGRNLDADGSERSLKNNTLELKAQAWAGDTGDILYEWKYTPAINIECEDEDVIYSYHAGVEYSYNDRDIVNEGGEIVTLPGFKHLKGQVNDKHFEPVPAGLTALVPGEQYFVAVEGEDDTYEAYTGTTVPSDVTLYERYTTYTVPAGNTKVTGCYRVVAKNSLDGAINNFSDEMPSHTCQLVSPDNVVFSANGDLKDHLIISDEVNGEKLLIDVNDNRDGTVEKYYWYKSIAKDPKDENVYEVIDDADKGNNFYVAKEPGHYRVVVEADLNREQKEITSTSCRVTFAPKIPNITYGQNAQEVIDGGSTETIEIFDDKGEVISSYLAPSYNQPDGTEITLDLNVEPFMPQEYEDAGYDSSFFSDSDEYKWYVQIGEDPIQEVTTESSFYVSGINSCSLTINKPKSNLAYRFKCLVKNNLNGTFKEQSLGDPEVLVFTVI